MYHGELHSPWSSIPRLSLAFYPGHVLVFQPAPAKAPSYLASSKMMRAAWWTYLNSVSDSPKPELAQDFCVMAMHILLTRIG